MLPLESILNEDTSTTLDSAALLHHQMVSEVLDLFVDLL